ncbi:MAG: DUF5683 domain-containing protein [Candidatus Kapabacteria bacterium]|nr:DUF5683 domain-containing protein [Candidatus Kapabacteria bacterium]
MKFCFYLYLFLITSTFSYSNDEIRFNLFCSNDTISKFEPENEVLSKSKPLLRDTGLFIMKKNPTSALWRSIIPGWGQFYNEQYWKAPIFLGSAVTLAGFIVYNNNSYNQYKNETINLLNPENKVERISSKNSKGDFFKLDNYAPEAYQLQLAKLKKEFYRDQRDLMSFYLIAVYILSAVDAYTGAHLYDFNVEENIAISIKPNTYGSASITFALKIK